jgi:DNA-binding winged helix-turn-helix (wHTH) protein
MRTPLFLLYHLGNNTDSCENLQKFEKERRRLEWTVDEHIEANAYDLILICHRAGLVLSKQRRMAQCWQGQVPVQ